VSRNRTAAAMLAVMLAAAASGARAQETAPPPAKPAAPSMAAKVAARQTDMMKNDLDLTQEQVDKVGPINQAEMTKLQELLARYKNDPSLDRKNLIRDAVAVSKSRDEQLRQVLTPPQWETWQAAKSERTAEGITRLMTVQLDLTSQQIPRIDQINRTAAKAMGAEIGRNFQEKSKREKARIARKLRDIGEERDRDLVKVLSTDQWGAYQKNKEEMREVMRERLEEQAP